MALRMILGRRKRPSAALRGNTFLRGPLHPKIGLKTAAGFYVILAFIYPV